MGKRFAHAIHAGGSPAFATGAENGDAFPEALGEAAARHGAVRMTDGVAVT